MAIYAYQALNNVASYFGSSDAGDIFVFFHTNFGTFDIVNWYRAHRAGDASIISPPAVLTSVRSDAVSLIIAGDVDIYHRKWLGYLHDSTAMADRLWNFCNGEGLKQFVSRLMRGDYLLDTVRYDVYDLAEVAVLPSIADHCVVSMDINVEVVGASQSLREATARLERLSLQCTFYVFSPSSFV